MKIASAKKKMPSTAKGSPKTPPNRPMRPGHSSPISNESTVPVTAPTANRTAIAFDHRRASLNASGSPLRSPRSLARRAIAGNATPKGTRMMWMPSVNAIWMRAGSNCGAPPRRTRCTIFGQDSGRAAIRPGGVPPPLLPLDGAGRLARHVVDHAVDAVDLGDDPGRDTLEHLVGQPGPVGRHRVLARHGAKDDRMLIGPPVAHHADAPHVSEEHREALPQLTVEARPADLVLHDQLGGAKDLQAFGRHLAHDPARDARPRDRLAPHDLLGQPELLPDLADLVLEQVAERLDELEVHDLGQPTDVVVALDPGSGTRSGLDHVRVERALHQEARPDRPRGLLEDANELLAHRPALGLRIRD